MEKTVLKQATYNDICDLVHGVSMMTSSFNQGTRLDIMEKSVLRNLKKYDVKGRYNQEYYKELKDIAYAIVSNGSETARYALLFMFIGTLEKRTGKSFAKFLDIATGGKN